MNFFFYCVPQLADDGLQVWNLAWETTTDRLSVPRRARWKCPSFRTSPFLHFLFFYIHLSESRIGRGMSLGNCWHNEEPGKAIIIYSPAPLLGPASLALGMSFRHILTRRSSRCNLGYQKSQHDDGS
jgi:hypothetical protein